MIDSGSVLEAAAAQQFADDFGPAVHDEIFFGVAAARQGREVLHTLALPAGL